MGHYIDLVNMVGRKVPNYIMLKEFENFFDNNISDNTLEQLNNHIQALDKNVDFSLPTPFKDIVGRKIVAICRKGVINTYPKYFLKNFRQLALIDENSKLGKLAYLFEHDVKKAKLFMGEHYDTKQLSSEFQEFIQNMDYHELEDIKRQIRESNIVYCKHPTLQSVFKSKIGLFFVSNNSKDIAYGTKGL